MPLAVLRYLLQIYYCGKSASPNSNLEDFSNLNGICGRSGDALKTRTRSHTLAHTHTALVFLTLCAPSREKAASNSNHGDQNTAVSERRTQSDASDEVSGCFQKQRSRRQLFTQTLPLTDAAVREVVIAAARRALGGLQPRYVIRRGPFSAALSASVFLSVLMEASRLLEADFQAIRCSK